MHEMTIDELIETRERLEQAEARMRELEADNAALQQIIDEAGTNPEGDYYFGLRCGVEDRDIHDRYEAAEFGWDQAFEYVNSVLENATSDHPGDKLLAVVKAAREYCDRPTKRNRWALTEAVDAIDTKGCG